MLRAFSYAWSLPVTWQRWRPVTQFDLPSVKTLCYTQTSWLYVYTIFIEPELRPFKLYIAEIGIFYLFPPVTLTLIRWPSYTNLSRIAWRYIACAKYELRTSRLSKSYRLTDRQRDRRKDGHKRNYISCRFAGGQSVHTKH